MAREIVYGEGEDQGEWAPSPVRIWTARIRDGAPTQAARQEIFAALAAADLNKRQLIQVARNVLGVRATSRAEALRALEIWYWDRVRGEGEAARILADYDPDAA
ncbi:MAG: hypothetical protein AAFW46_11590 [Pseudomonadota bacterium]